MTEDIYTTKSFKFSWGHTQAPSSADGSGELLVQSELAHQARQWGHQQHQMCPGIVTPRAGTCWGCEAQEHGCGDSSTSMSPG